MTRKMRLAGGVIFGLTLACAAVQPAAQAQVAAGLPGETVTYETVQPGYKSVTYGEKIKVRRFGNKRVTVEKPRRYVNYTPPVVQETRVIRPAPVTQQVVVQPAPVVEEHWVQPAPVLERRVVQPPPVVRTQVIPQEPVVQTRYLGGAPL